MDCVAPWTACFATSLSVSVEKEPRAAAVVRDAWPGTIEVDDVHKVDREFVGRILRVAAEMGVRVTVLGGGWPCQDVSRLNSQRVGATGMRTGLFGEFVRIADLVQEFCRLWSMQFVGLGECTVMDHADEQLISQSCRWSRVECCSSGSSRVRRPRFFWCEPPVCEGQGLALRAGHRGSVAALEGPLEPEAAWVLPGWRFVSDHDDKVRLPTFTRAIPRSRPPPGAPGLWTVPLHVRGRYEADWRRFGPYTYDDRFCLIPEGDSLQGADTNPRTRVAVASEREVLMGFLPGHTRKTHKGAPGLRAADGFEEDTVRCALIGNSFHTTAVATIVGNQLCSLGHACFGVPPRVLHERLLEELLEHEQSGAGRVVDALVDLEAFIAAPGPRPGSRLIAEDPHSDSEVWQSFGSLFPAREVPLAPANLQRRAAELWLAEAHMRACSAKGAEVRSDLGVPLSVNLIHRVSIDTRRWDWRHVVACKVKRKGHHINRLEL